MTFREAVEAVPALSGCHHPGLQALAGPDRSRVRARDTRSLAGSVNVEAALKSTLPNSPLWDYGIAVRVSGSEQVTWIEVHPADSGHVGPVLAKLAWLKDWLRESAPALDALTRPGRGYVWLATGAVSLPPTSPKRRLIAQRGLVLVSAPLEL